MSQREKARVFLARNGHAREAAAATVKPGDKNAAAPRLGPAIAPAREQTAYEGGMMAQDGLLRGHASRA